MIMLIHVCFLSLKILLVDENLMTEGRKNIPSDSTSGDKHASSPIPSLPASADKLVLALFTTELFLSSPLHSLKATLLSPLPLHHTATVNGVGHSPINVQEIKIK